MKTPLEDLASLALFASVVQRGSFTAAANDAGLAKSAVSKRISLLEERLGARLLLRTTRKLSLTEDGMRYYEHCAALLAAADAAEDAVAGASTAPRGSLRINAPVSFSHMFMAEALATFMRRYPDIDVHLSADDRFVDVVEGGFDVVVRVTRLSDSNLVARKLASDRLVVCAAPSYLAGRGRPSTPADLLAHDCMHYSLVSREGEWRFRGSAGPYSVPVRGSFSSSDGATLCRAAVAGAGLAVLPMFMVAAHVRAGRLELVLEGARKAEIGIYAMFSSRRQLPGRTKLLLEHLATWFAAADWRLRGLDVR